MRLQPVIFFFVAIAVGGLGAKVCTTPGCLEIAKLFQDYMDTSVNPCDDFYQFTCGNFIKKAVIQDWEELSSFSSLIEKGINQELKHELEAKTLKGQPSWFQKAKDYYQSCMDTDRLEKYSIMHMKRLLDNYGGWPVLEENWNEDGFDWINSTSKMMLDGQEAYQIIEIGYDLGDDGNWTMAIADGIHELDGDTLLKGLENPLVQSYLGMIVDHAVAFGADRERAKEDMTEVVKLEMALFNLSYIPVDIPVIPQNISELQEVWSYIPWLDLIRKNFLNEVSFPESFPIEANSPHYLTNLRNLLPTIPKRTLANYMMSRVVFGGRYYLNQEMFNISWRSNSVEGQVFPPGPRSDVCIEDLKDNLVMPMAAIFVRKYFSPEKKQGAEKIMAMLQDQFADIVANEDWITNDTRIRSMTKVKNIKYNIGYPPELLNDTLLNDFMKGLHICPRDYYGNSLAINKCWTHRTAHKLGTPGNYSSWDNLPLSQTMIVQGQYFSSTNTLVFFSGQLQNLSFSLDRPMYVNLGTMGALAAQILSNSLDTYARNYDENGDEEEWWDPASEDAFDKRVQALNDEYSSYVVKEVNMTLNADNIISTAMADQGGIKTARMVLDTWLSQHGGHEPKLKGLEKYSEAQVFWLGVAVNFCAKWRVEWTKWSIINQVVPPDESRVKVPLRQSEQFARDWNCPVGSYMNPKDKVNVW